MIEDAQLLRRYAAEKSEEAFAELVRRRIDFVYAAALRRVGGDAHLAEDVTQQVFTAMARSAAVLSRHPALVGWLYTTARFTAARIVRTERRRRLREQEVFSMNEILSDSSLTGDWERLRPVLDHTMDQLNESDREAVLLRFFENRSFAELGARFRVTENAARMRVERALEKMGTLLERRGVASTAGALGMALASQAGVAAPVGLAANVTGAALAGTALSGGAVACLGFMSMSKLQVGIVIALVAAGVTGLVVQSKINAALQSELAALRREGAELAALRTDNVRLAKAAATLTELRLDEAELARLRDEAEALKKQQQVVTASVASVRPPLPQSPWPNGQPVYDLAQLDKAPEAKFRPIPEYPAELRRNGIGGKAMISFVVDLNGDMQEVKVISSTDTRFAESAVAAIKLWKYQPGEKSGQAVNAQVKMPMAFTLDTPVEQAARRPLSPLNWF